MLDCCVAIIINACATPVSNVNATIRSVTLKGWNSPSVSYSHCYTSCAAKCAGVGILDRLGVNCITDGLHLCAFTCDVGIWCDYMAMVKPSADLYAITLDDCSSASLAHA